MKITEDVRRFADENGLNDENEAITAGMAQKAKEFIDAGAEIYSDSSSKK